jgi:hypothetical protein
MFGETMAGLLTGMPHDELPLPFTNLKTVPMSPIISRFYQVAFTANKMINAI